EPMDEARANSQPDLVDELRRRIEREGRITFAHFMRDALYHSKYGYYVNSTARPGRDGDFLTAPEAHSIFGYTLARQIAQMADLLGRPQPFTLREYGAGAGTLALALLEGLHVERPDLLPTLRYEPVEINPARLSELRRTLIDEGFDAQLDGP